MDEKPLRIAFVGTGEFGLGLLAALKRTPRVQLVGLADQNGSAAAGAGKLCGCEVYQDNRQLLSQSRCQAVVMAIPPASSAHVAAMAFERGCHVWAAMPIAPGLAQAVALCRQADQAGVKLVVGAYRRFMPGYARAKEMLSRLGEVYHLEMQYLFNRGGSLGWRGDRSAGGGAMMELGSHALDLAIWMLGLPVSVYCATGTDQRPSRTRQGLYDSDDTACLVLRYGQGASASLTVSRSLAPFREELTIHGEEGSLQAQPHQCTLRDRQGAVLENFRQEQSPTEALAGQFEAFAADLAGKARCRCWAWENLLTTACVEAGYLSDRTNQPENPQALLAGYNIALGDCTK